MKEHCPRPLELTRLLDGELTENRAARVRAHAEACEACRTELDGQARLLELIAAPVPGIPSPGALAAVMGRLDAADAAASAPVRRRPWPTTWIGLAAVAAAAAAVLVVVPRPAPRDGRFNARGPAVAWTRKVGVELWALPGPPRRLAPGDLLPADVPVMASYSNVDTAPAWLLAFALDEAGEVHWLFPAYLDAAQDPPSVRLEGSVLQRTLPDSVVFEDVPAGPLRLVTVVSPAPLRVSDVEGLRPADRTPEALQRRWPDARVDALPVQYAPPSAAPARSP